MYLNIDRHILLEMQFHFNLKRTNIEWTIKGKNITICVPTTGYCPFSRYLYVHLYKYVRQVLQ